MQGVLYVQIVLFKFLDSLIRMFQGICFLKFVMESFVLSITWYTKGLSL